MKELLDWLTGKSRKKDQERAIEVLGEYSFGNMFAFTSEFPEQAREMFRNEALMQALAEYHEQRGARTRGQHHMVPMVRIIRKGTQHYLQYGHEWRDDQDFPNTDVLMSGRMTPIGRRNARQIMERFREYDESEHGRPRRHRRS